MAACDVIVREAGGRFSSLDGTDGPFGGNALASNGHLHEAALSFLGALPDDDDDPDSRPRGPGSVSELRARRLREREPGPGASAPHADYLSSPGTEPRTSVEPMRIGDVLGAKPSQEVVTIAPEAGVRDLIAPLAEHNVGALIVSADGDTVDGIVSERDVVRHLHHDGTVINNTVGAIMTTEVETCEHDVLLDDLMKVMTDRRIRHVPVVDDGT